MDIANQPKLKFYGVDFINLKFNSSRQYDGKTTINLDIQPKVFFPKQNEFGFKIFMEVTVQCDNFFNLYVVGIGNFEFDKDFANNDLKKIFINTNAPAIMFPYVRSFITTLTTNIGNVTGPLILPTQFFKGEIPELVITKEAEEE